MNRRLGDPPDVISKNHLVPLSASLAQPFGLCEIWEWKEVWNERVRSEIQQSGKGEADSMNARGLRVG